MKELQKARAQCVKGLCRVLMIGILALIVYFVSSEWVKSVKQWNELDFGGNLNHIYVKEVVPDLYGEFYVQHSGDTGDVKKAYYLQATGNGKYMIISFKAEEIAKAEALMTAYEQYVNDEITEAELESFYFTTQGKIKRLKEGKAAYVHLLTYVNWYGMTEESRELLLFYELEAESITYRNGQRVMFGCLTGFCIIFLAIVEFFARGPFGKKALKKYIKKSGNPEIAKEKVKNFFDHEQVAPDLWLNKEFIGGLQDQKVVFGELKKLVWMYETDKTEKATMSMSVYCINLHFEDGSKQQMLYNESLEQLFGWMRENCPWVILEYSDELKELFYKDLSAFLSRQYYSTIKV